MAFIMVKPPAQAGGAIEEIWEGPLTGQTETTIETGLTKIFDAEVHAKTGFTNPTYGAYISSRTEGIGGSSVGVKCTHAGETSTVVVTLKGVY